MFRPTQLDLITKKLGEISIHCCAHEDYLALRGTPRQLGDLEGHDMIGMDRSDLMLSVARGVGIPLTRDNFALRTDSQTLLWEMVKAGLGISFAQKGLIAEAKGIVPLLPEFKVPSLEVWLTTHRELYTSRKIRVIYDRLAEGLSAYISRTQA
jgi:DNA-binding transcriptional LysR family regulator